MKSLFHVLSIVIFLGTFQCGYGQVSRLYENKSSPASSIEKHYGSKDGSVRAENSRSDTIDITDYNIRLHITDFVNKKISGSCIVSFKSKLDGISFIDLDLLELVVDSVLHNGELAAFTHSAAGLLHVTLLQSLNSGEATSIEVFYQGKPVVDATGWGGFYFSGEYAYNLGVGFGADPHCYGRVWFPCFDNFVERSTYHFSITTAGAKMALCNGELLSGEENSDGTKTWNWELLSEIPSYLACVAVGNYTPVYLQYDGMEGSIPVQLGAAPTDTTKMKNSFVHLLDALSIFENSFGAYKWPKVGYSLVPFSSGAMEHATNIAYPIFMADGTTNWESFLMHELSHHWFGDLVTCSTEEDMWLNEGWASYCEEIFREFEYGKDAYDESIAANHANVLHYTHTLSKDGAYYPLSGVPHEVTYGSTVYDKGKDVAHTLRGYMGDSLFFHCITAFLETYAFSDASSGDLRDFLSDCSGTDLSDFFNNWVFSPGFPQFSIDSMQVFPGGNTFNVNVFIKQRLNHAPQYYQNVPLEITFMNSEWNTLTEKFTMSGQCGIYTTTLPFDPEYACLDLSEKISDAISAASKTISATGLHTFSNGMMNVTVAAIPDAAFIRVEHNYAPPDRFKIPVTGLHISDYRYWNVDGIIPGGFEATAVIHYDGSNSSAGGFLDNSLISNSEDSLVVLFRPTVKDDWTILSDVTQNFQGSHSDKRGSFTINHLLKGAYTFGIFDYDKPDTAAVIPAEPCAFLSAPEPAAPVSETLELFPNPASSSFNIRIADAGRFHLLEIYNLYGGRIHAETLKKGSTLKTVGVNNWTPGPYLVSLTDEVRHKIVSQIIIIK